MHIRRKELVREVKVRPHNSLLRGPRAALQRLFLKGYVVDQDRKKSSPQTALKSLSKGALFVE